MIAGRVGIACLVCAGLAAGSETRIYPEHFVYQGAFRMPAGYDYAGSAMTFYPGGDPEGPDDGYPGSIYAVGHAHRLDYAEIAIPRPVQPASGARDDCPAAAKLRDFHDINSVFTNQNYSSGQRVTAIEYLDAQEGQSAGKLYFAYGDSYIPSGDQLSFAWCELDFTGVRGPWGLRDINIHCQADYLFEIPGAWAREHTPGMRLLTGRYRNGSWCGHGPAFFSFGPWLSGNPPPPGAELDALELLHYTSDSAIVAYHSADKWTGGAWLELDGASAVILSGRKGLGEHYYGIQCGTKGYQSSGGYAAGFLFFDPADLAAAAHGAVDVWTPQPYELFSVNDILFNPNADSCDMNMIDALCYDRSGNILYGLEGDGSRSTMHVWKIQRADAGISSRTGANRPAAAPGAPRIRAMVVSAPGDLGAPAGARLYDVRGRELTPLGADDAHGGRRGDMAASIVVIRREAPRRDASR